MNLDVLSELFARDVDRDLVRQARSRTPTERLRWLEEMQAFAEAAKEARRDAAERAARPSR